MKTKKTVLICLIISLFGGAVAALLRTTALFNNYDAVSGHFVLGEVGMKIKLAYAAVVLAALAVGAICFINRKMLAKGRLSHGRAYVIGAFSFTLGAMTELFEAVSSYKNREVANGVIDLLIAFFAAFACATVLANAFLPSKKENLIRAGVSLAPVFFIVLPAYKAYFDPELVMNCQNKNVYIVAACCAALSVVAECRFDCYQKTPAWFVLAASATVSCGIFCAVPDLIYFFVRGDALLNGIGADVAVLGFIVYAAMRLVSFRKMPKTVAEAEK